MTQKFSKFLALLLMFSLLLGACTPAATEAPVATEAPATEVAVEVTEAPAALEVPALLEDFWASVPADKGYGSVGAAKLNEEFAEKAPFLVDVREPSEIESDGYIEGAVNIPIRTLLQNLDKLPGLDEPIVIYCASGHRGGLGLMSLKILGYTNVRNLGGGLGGWKKAELPVVTGSQPAAPEAISTPIVEDELLFNTLNDYLTNLPEGFSTVKADALNAELADKAPFLVDVRSVDEWNKDGYIEGAVHIPFPEFLDKLDQLPDDKDAAIVIYCASGHRGSMAMFALNMLGYTNIRNLGGGLNAWKGAGLPVAGYVDWATVWGEYLAALPEGFYTIKPADLNSALADNPPFLLDVREAAEISNDGFIAGAVNIPVREVLANLDKLPAQDQPIVVYCASGHRGAMVMAALQFLGYNDVKNLAGGLGGWKKAELAVETGAPAAPSAGTAPEVDAARFAALNKFLSELPDGFNTVKPADLNAELAGTPAPFIFDVRSDEEFAGGVVAGAVHIKIQDVPANLAQLPTDKAAPIVVLCQSGHRGALAMMYLRMTGYTNVRNLGGGMNAWIAAELPVVK
jgi:rhodanese-related sulfurtransferase